MLMLAVPALAAETLDKGETRKAVRTVVEGDVASLLGTATETAKVRVWNCRERASRGSCYASIVGHNVRCRLRVQVRENAETYAVWDWMRCRSLSVSQGRN